ncbi:MAG TPA: hypothetical protein VEM93_03585 [Actinomycetota bacterium]|nr:hypothetical protein [Actinomycetota bacterium]
MHVFHGDDHRAGLGEDPKRPQGCRGYRPLVRSVAFRCPPQKRDLEGYPLGLGKLLEHIVGETTEQIA